MTAQRLADMSLSELQSELAAATNAREAAEYQDGLGNFQRAMDAAVTRKRAVEQEVDRRLAMLRVAEWKDGKSGG